VLFFLPLSNFSLLSMAVTRSKDAPPFGPPIPSGTTFRKSDVFRDFLLAKVINAENAAHKSDKFHTMATRTRQEYLKDLAENCVSNTPIDSSGKFNLISLTSKKKEKTKARVGAEQHSAGAVAWRVAAQDYARGVEIECILGISNEFVVLLDLRTKEVVFNCACGDVIGWTPDASTLKIFYGQGDHVFLQAAEGSAEHIREIVQRLKVRERVPQWYAGACDWQKPQEALKCLPSPSQSGRGKRVRVLPCRGASESRQPSGPGTCGFPCLHRGRAKDMHINPKS
jgi:signal-induced proliferation-associated 1 like protein 3